MPKRTNEKQEIIALLRRLLATDQCEVAESRMLRCARTGALREVDVVMECKLEDVTVIVSFEVLGHARKADVEWVERMIAKHQSLSTNKLFLVSWSGFTEVARRRAGAEPHVIAVTPEAAVGEGASNAPKLFAEEVSLTARKVVLIVDAGGATPSRVSVLPDNAVFKMDGSDAGTVQDFTAWILNEPGIVERVLREMHDHPEREDVRWFVVGVPLQDETLALRKEPEMALHPIRIVEVSGEITWSQQRVDLDVKKFGDVVFGHGRATLGGRRALMVATLGEKDSVGRVTTRIYANDPG